MPSCLPPETKPIIAGAAGGGGGGSPVDGKMLAAAGGGGATPDKMSLAACGRTPGTNCGFDMFLPGRVGVGWVWWARGCCRLRGRPRGRGRGITNDANLRRGYLDVHETEGVCLGFTGEGAEDEADEARLARLFDGVVGQPVCRTGEETQLRHNQAHQAAPPVCAAVCAAPETV